MIDFDKALGKIFRSIVVSKIKVNTIFLDDYICFDFYNTGDVFDIYYSKNVFIGDVNGANEIIDFIENSQIKSSYIATYEDDIFNINKCFENKFDADEFCKWIRDIYNINIKVETRDERIKKN